MLTIITGLYFNNKMGKCLMKDYLKKNATVKISHGNSKLRCYSVTTIGVLHTSPVYFYSVVLVERQSRSEAITNMRFVLVGPLASANIDSSSDRLNGIQAKSNEFLPNIYIYCKPGSESYKNI